MECAHLVFYLSFNIWVNIILKPTFLEAVVAAALADVFLVLTAGRLLGVDNRKYGGGSEEGGGIGGEGLLGPGDPDKPQG